MVFRRADLGMVFRSAPEGIVVSKLKKRGDAALQGVKLGDRVTGLNDTALTTLLAESTDNRDNSANREHRKSGQPCKQRAPQGCMGSHRSCHPSLPDCMYFVSSLLPD